MEYERKDAERRAREYDLEKGRREKRQMVEGGEMVEMSERGGMKMERERLMDEHDVEMARSLSLRVGELRGKRNGTVARSGWV